MKKNRIVLMTIFLLIVSLKRPFAQSRLEVIVDTFKITEAGVADSTIIPVLDSAITFLRVPPPEYGTYYYGLVIIKHGKDKGNNIDKEYRKIVFYAVDHLVINNNGLLDFKKDKKMLFKYKNIPIVIYDFYDCAAEFFKPLANKTDYYYYHKVDKKDPNSIIVPEKTYTQQAEFIVGKNYLNFLGYKILYTLWDENGFGIFDLPD